MGRGKKSNPFKSRKKKASRNTLLKKIKTHSRVAQLEQFVQKEAELKQSQVQAYSSVFFGLNGIAKALTMKKLPLLHFAIPKTLPDGIDEDTPVTIGMLRQFLQPVVVPFISDAELAMGRQLSAQEFEEEAKQREEEEKERLEQEKIKNEGATGCMECGEILAGKHDKCPACESTEVEYQEPEETPAEEPSTPPPANHPPLAAKEAPKEPLAAR